MSFLSRSFRRAFSTTVSTTIESGSVRTLSRDLFKERNLKKLVEKFKKSSELERFRTQTGIYESTVRRLASAKRFKWIEEILEEQKKYSNVSKEGFAVRLISLYGKSGMFDNALKTFNEMPQLNCDRTVLSFNALLGACVSCKKFDEVETYFRQVPGKVSIEPDLVSYNTIIKAFCEMGSLDSALLMVDEMEKKGLKPDLITFNTLLHVFYGNNHFGDGEKVWARMNSESVEPDIRSYNAKLLGLANEKKTLKAVEVFEEMKTRGLKPDVFSFNTLIKGYCNEGNLEEAKRWFDEMVKRDCAPNKVTFATLVRFSCEKGDYDMAFDLTKEIFKRKCLVDDGLLQLVVDGLGKESKINEAKEVVKLAKSNKFCRYKVNLPSDA